VAARKGVVELQTGLGETSERVPVLQRAKTQDRDGVELGVCNSNQDLTIIGFARKLWLINLSCGCHFAEQSTGPPLRNPDTGFRSAKPTTSIATAAAATCDNQTGINNPLSTTTALLSSRCVLSCRSFLVQGMDYIASSSSKLVFACFGLYPSQHVCNPRGSNFRDKCIMRKSVLIFFSAQLAKLTDCTNTILLSRLTNLASLAIP
jgi:hypothetical protein